MLTPVLTLVLCTLGWAYAAAAAAAAPAGLLATAAGRHVAMDAYADLDGDGRVDEVSASCDTDCAIEVTLSQGDTVVRIDDAPTPIRGLIVADIDRDGDEDVVVLRRDGVLAVLANNGHGQFSAPAPVAPSPQRQPVPWDGSDHLRNINAGASGDSRPDPVPLADLTAIGSLPVRSHPRRAVVSSRPVASGRAARTPRAPPILSLQR